MAPARRLTSWRGLDACLGAVYRAFSTFIPSAPPFAAPPHAPSFAASSRSDQPTIPRTAYDLEQQGSAAEPLIHPAVSAASGPSVLAPSDLLLSPDDANRFEVMAVPKRKVTPSRRGIRNGPKALKAVPVVELWVCEAAAPVLLQGRGQATASKLRSSTLVLQRASF